MDENTASVVAGSVRLINDSPGRIAIMHTSPHGAVRIDVDAVKLERWCLRLLREETFKPAREAA